MVESENKLDHFNYYGDKINDVQKIETIHFQINVCATIY